MSKAVIRTYVSCNDPAKTVCDEEEWSLLELSVYTVSFRRQATAPKECELPLLYSGSS
jgi:hypothetical protein